MLAPGAALVPWCRLLLWPSRTVMSDLAGGLGSPAAAARVAGSALEPRRVEWTRPARLDPGLRPRHLHRSYWAGASRGRRRVLDRGSLVLRRVRGGDQIGSAGSRSRPFAWLCDVFVPWVAATPGRWLLTSRRTPSPGPSASLLARGTAPRLQRSSSPAAQADAYRGGDFPTSTAR